MILPKHKAIEYIFQYSKYHGNLLLVCENIYNEKRGIASLLILFNLLEIILKNAVNDFEDRFVNLIEKAFSNGMLNAIEYNF